MKTMLNLALTGAAIISIAPPVEAAAFLDGNQLYQWCTAREADANYYQQNASCRSYVVGVVDDFSLEMQIAKKTDCIPANATRGQLADVVVKYLRDEPGQRSYGAAVLVRLAMFSAFGCNFTR